MKSQLVLGSRGSALALAQVALVEQALARTAPSLRIRVAVIRTGGDEPIDLQAVKESSAGAKGLFTKEIEEALAGGKIDVAVHSMKDLPARMPADLEIAAVLERADTDDVLISKSAPGFDALGSGSTIGTSSVRRKRQILWRRPDLQVVELRGNVPTRLQKLRDSEALEAIVLARAGLQRLGYECHDRLLRAEEATFRIDSMPMLPAIGQGAIALQIRHDDPESGMAIRAINHLPTFVCTRAEREFQKLLDGDCQLPVGVRTHLNGDSLSMEAIVFGDMGESPLTGNVSGSASQPEAVARELFQQMYGA